MTEVGFIELPNKQLIFDRIAKVTSGENTAYTPEDEMELCKCYDELGQIVVHLQNKLMCQRHLLDEEVAKQTIELKLEKEGTKNKYTEAQIDSMLTIALRLDKQAIIGTKFELDAVLTKKDALEKYITCVRDFMKASTWSSV